jgi:hypothetical protein
MVEKFQLSVDQILYRNFSLSVFFKDLVPIWLSVCAVQEDPFSCSRLGTECMNECSY